MLQLAQVLIPVEQVKQGLWHAVHVDPSKKSVERAQERQKVAELHVEQGVTHKWQVFAAVFS